MGIRIMAELPLAIGTPRVKHSMHISFIDTSILNINNRSVAAKFLSCSWARSETLKLLILGKSAVLNRNIQTILTVIIFAETFWTWSARDHLCCLEKYCLLYLMITPIEAALVHYNTILNKPRFKNFLINRSKQDIFKHLT